MSGAIGTTVRSRREFFGTTAMAVAGTLLGVRALRAGTPVLLPIYSSASVHMFLPEGIPVPELERLAHNALDAAISAGASYADVRIAERHWLLAELTRVLLYTECTYGVRTLVEGTWGFAYGRAPNSEAMARCAQSAVHGAQMAAQASAQFSTILTTWVPAPVVTGVWNTPIQIDPFTIPVQQHAELQQAIGMMVERTPGSRGSFRAHWTKETRVVAASTGTLVTQTLHRAVPELRATCTAQFGNSMIPLSVPNLRAASAGYEILLVPNLAEQFDSAAEEAMRLARLPRRALAVGRYPIVMDGNMMGNVLVTLVGPSLELDRVIGGDTNASGTSQFSLDRLGTPIAGPLMNVTGHRAFPSVSAVQWDDEGNVPCAHPVIQAGVLMDYHTDGTTVSALASWYRQHQRPPVANGCAVASEAQHIPSVQAPHLTMTPSTSRTSLTDLCRDMSHGIVAMHHGWLATDQQLASGSIASNWSGLFEVSRGKLVRRLWNMGVQCNTLPFLKTLSALGDQATMRTQDVVLTKGIPWVESQHGATAPAALFKEINVISLPRG